MCKHDQRTDQCSIALIGIGCRFPGGVTDPDEYWKLLVSGTNAVTEIPDGRWDVQRYYHPDPAQPGKYSCPKGAFLSQVDQFDASFFGITPTEASRMDPQQRLLLEVCWEALEDAGLVPSRLAGSRTGVFIGISFTDYGMLQFKDVSSINAYTNAGQTCSIASNRISYLFDFRGPSLSVDTACSSSLVAVHLACQSLLKGECSMALVGGVSVILEPAWYVGLSKASMLSPQGACRAFDAGANGYVRGEGAGMVVLKPLLQAQADGDPIYAVIRATGINQDGRTRGLHQPSHQAQEELLRQVYAKVGISPEQVTYVEAHGTGTTVGDFIESHALGSVLGKPRPAGKWLRIGSVKTQIGHLEPASGMASLIKTALLLKKRQVPANLHFENPNPQIPFEDFHLKVQRQLEPLPEDGELPIAGINNFGFGGTNAHVVLQAVAPQQVQLASLPPVTPYLLPLSARHLQALRTLAQSYRDLLIADASSAPSLRDLCFTASIRREHHVYRLGVVGCSHTEFAAKLEAFLASQPQTGGVYGHGEFIPNSGVTFVFSGNGPQWWGMGRKLLTENALFRAQIEECDRLYSSYAGWSLLEELSADEAQSRMHRTDVAQPTLFALQVGLTTLWKAWGIEPQAVIGHSVGEIAAAHVAGILSLDDAIKVVYHRSRLQERTAGMGKMAAVGLSEQEARMLLSDYVGLVELASINSPSSVTLSGDATALEAILAQLDQQGIFARLLPLNYAFHNACLEPIRDDLLSSLRDIHPQPAHTRFISTVTGQELSGSECDATYWWKNIRCPVQFAAGVGQFLEQSNPIFLEVGPHPVLAHYLSECLQSAERGGTILPSLRRKENDQFTLLGSLATLYTRGCLIRWEALIESGGHVSLPRYPWQRERYWNAPKTVGMALQGKITHPLLGARLRTALPIWENVLDQQTVPLLSEHRVDNAAIISLAGYVKMVHLAAEEIFGEKAFVVENVKVDQPLILSENRSLTVQVQISHQDFTFQITSLPQDEEADWMTHITGQIHPLKSTASHEGISREGQLPFEIKEFRQRCLRELTHSEFYQECLPANVGYSPRFQCVERVSLAEGEALAVIRWPEIANPHEAHLVFLDNCVQALFALVPPKCIPVSVKQLRMYRQSRDMTLQNPTEDETAHSDASVSPCCVRQPDGRYFLCSACLVKKSGDTFSIDAVVVDEEGRPVIEINQLCVQIASFLRSPQDEMVQNYLYEARWVSSPVEQGEQTASPSPSATSCNWLIFADEYGIAAWLMEKIRAQGEKVVVVEKGEMYQRLATHRFVLRPGSGEDMRRLLETLQAEAWHGEQIVYLWGGRHLEQEIPSAQSLQSLIITNCFGVVSLVQHMTQMGGTSLPKLWIVTCGAQVPDAKEYPTVEQAPLYGMGRVIHNEHPELYSTLVDIGAPQKLPGGYTYDESVLEALYRELQTKAEESEVLLRGHARYVNRISRVELDSRSPETSTPLLRSDACYLIIGGVSGFGFETAKWMVRRGARHLILASLSGLATKQIRDEVEALRADGSNISVVSLDVTQEQDVERLFEQLRSGPLPLRGVIHAAALFHDRPIRELDEATIATVMAPKVMGAWNLHKQTQTMPLDFFLLYSSVTVLVGNNSQGSYVAGNAFMDALAHWRRTQGLPATAVEWGALAQVGVVAQNKELSDILTRKGLSATAPQQYLNLLETTLSTQQPLLAIANVDWRRLDAFLLTRSSRLRCLDLLSEEMQEASGNPQDLTRVLLATAPEDRQALVQEYLTQALAKLLGKPTTSLTSHSADLGLDSLMAMELRHTLRKDLKIDIPVMQILHVRNLSSMAILLTERLVERV